MKIIRWFLSHTFLFILIVAVIYGYMFWGNLLGEDTPAGKAVAYLSSEFVEVEEFVNAIKAKQAELNGEKVVAQDSPEAVPPESIDTAAPGTAPEVPEMAATEHVGFAAIKHEVAATAGGGGTAAGNNEASERTNIEQLNSNHQQSLTDDNQDQKDMPQVASTPVIEEKSEISSTDGGQDKVASTTEKVVVIESDAKGAFVSPEIERQLENVDEQGKVVDESLHSNVVIESWITARKSFYQRNYDLSEQSYRMVIAKTEDNFDAYGELGNVYFNQGKKQQAATAYFEAAAILVRKGQINRARSMVGVLNFLDKDRANELQRLINTVSS